MEDTKAGIRINNGPRMLPRVSLSNGKTYFVDERLNELRNIYDFTDIIDLSINGVRACDWDKIQEQYGQFTQFITITCIKCRKELFSGTEGEAKGRTIYCIECN